MSRDERRVPVSSHPGFRWIVALWFALLLGLGLLVMPASVHHTIAERTGLHQLADDTVVLRGALAAAAAVIGLLLGLAIAARIVRANAVALTYGGGAEPDEEVGTAEVWLDDDDPADGSGSTSDETPRRPFNPREEVDHAGIGFEAMPGPPPAALVAAQEADLDGGDSANAGDAGRSDPAEELSAAEPQPSETSAPIPDRAPLGDLTLSQLTDRLGAALAQHQALYHQGVTVGTPSDPVVSFLKREANRSGSESVEPPAGSDAQAELRNALERLNRVASPK